MDEIIALVSDPNTKFTLSELIALVSVATAAKERKIIQNWIRELRFDRSNISDRVIDPEVRRFLETAVRVRKYDGSTSCDSSDNGYEFEFNREDDLNEWETFIWIRFKGNTLLNVIYQADRYFRWDLSRTWL